MWKYLAAGCVALVAFVTCGACGGDDQPKPSHTDDAAVASAPEPVADCIPPYCSWSTAEAACPQASVPTEALRPKARSDAPADLAPIYLGLSRLSLSGAPNGQNRLETLAGSPAETDAATDGDAATDADQGPIGFDLDGQCTRVPGCESAAPCVQPNATPMPDGPFCADNAYARLHAEALTAAPDSGAAPALRGGASFVSGLALSEDVVNCSLRQGRYNQVLRLTGYNGSAADDQVRVDFYASTGLEESAQDDAFAPCTEGAHAKLAWKPGAAFRILENDLAAPMSTPEGLPNSKIVANGFVLDGVLLAFVEQGYELELFGASEDAPTVQFNLRQAVVTGRLVKNDGTFHIEDGAIAGRQAAQDVMRSFERVGVCEHGDYAALHQAIGEYLENYADITLEPDAPADSVCDGVSTGFRFEAESVTPGSVAPERQVLNCCLPENSGRGACPVVRCGDGEVSDDEACDVAIAAGEAGACPAQCDPTDPCQPLALQGENCDARCVATPITLPLDGDACCPAGATSANDDDCPAVCGNGAVEAAGEETCDPPETCPKAADCDVGSNFCAVTTFSGSAETCNARCETVSNTACSNDDGCCSPGCDFQSDNDCSSTCGNGKIDEKETCDGNCPTACSSDDGDACTTADLVGTTAQCSAQCIVHKVTRCADGDSCCPAGCNGGTDDDCAIKCGNSFPEPGEECDDGNQTAGDGCDDCTLETPERACMALTEDVSTVSTACLECMCDNCADEMVSCFTTGSADDRRTCGDLAICRLRTWCIGLDCLNGPCTSEVEAAGMSTSVVTLISRAQNPQHRFGRATNVENCSQSNCTNACAR